MLLYIDKQSDSDNMTIRVIGIQMVVSRLGKSLTIELLRLIDSLRQRAEGDSDVKTSSWDSPIEKKVDAGYSAFMLQLQQELLQAYSTS